MILNQPLDRTAQDGAEGKTFFCSSLCQLIAKIPSDTAYTRDSHPHKTIGTDVVAEEIAEIVDHNLPHSVI